MQLRGHGTAVAVVLSVLALAVAGGGTAVAVSSTVSIADPTNPARMAKVDQTGRLAVVAPVSTIAAAGYLYGYQDGTSTQITSATAATLAITRVQISDPSANAGSAEQQLELSRYPVDASGSCVTTTTPTLVARYNVAPGDDVDDPFPAPLVVKSPGNTRYCLFVKALYLGGSSATPTYYLTYGVSAYAVAGVYTGIGSDSAPAATAQPGSAVIGR